MRIVKDEEHPCWRASSRQRSHRSGGFGGTCERCGTQIGVKFEEIGPISWVPVKPPEPYQPGSLQRAIYDAVCASNVPMHQGNKIHLTDFIVAVIEDINT